MPAILDAVTAKTKEYLETMPKTVRKKKGQFFTSLETAVFMAELFNLERLQEEVTILDPGAGSGILSAAIIERINQHGGCRSISLTCYETDSEVQPLLLENLKLISSLSKIPVQYNLFDKDYILSQQDDFNNSLFSSLDPVKYDLIISNPPYLRVMRDDKHALAMPSVVHGAPNLYFLFASMSLFNLKDNCEMVYIIPRSWTSGAYFEAFRKYLLTNGKLEQIHLFVSRDSVFKEEQVLQETIIIKVIKSQIAPPTIIISSSQNNNDFQNVKKQYVPYDTVVSGQSLYVYLPTSDEEINVLEQIGRYQKTLPQEGLRMRTGIVVDFRQWDDLLAEPGEHILPLFYAQHIRNGRVNHDPSGKEFDWIIDEKPGLIQKNKNYVFCKRFTAKEEKRRLQCGIYLKSDFPQYEKIGTQNKINYVDWIDTEKEMSLPVAYGIYALLNSTLFDQYYRILNGSTQVNSTEINSIPVPPISLIEQIGCRLMATADLSIESSDAIVMEVAYGKD